MITTWLAGHIAYLSYVTGPLAALAMRVVGLRRKIGWIMTACVQVGVTTLAIPFGLYGLLFQTVPCFAMAVTNYVDWKRVPPPQVPFRLVPKSSTRVSTSVERP